MFDSNFETIKVRKENISHECVSVNLFFWKIERFVQIHNFWDMFQVINTKYEIHIQPFMLKSAKLSCAIMDKDKTLCIKIY